MKFTYLFFLIAILGACSPKNKESKKNSSQRIPRATFKVLSPTHNSVYHYNDSLTVAVAPDQGTFTIDSISLSINRKKLGNYQQSKVTLPLQADKLGQNQLKVKAYFSDGTSRLLIRNLWVLSDVKPKKLSYQLIKKHPHPKERFTQGLVYEKPYLYEGTGQHGSSNLYKSEFSTGEVLKSVALPESRFGEGVAIYGDKIVELTWEKQEAYVYNKQDLSFQKTLKYPYSSEGWGITFDGKDLIMSNGSAQLLYVDTTDFSKIRAVTIADNIELADSLNEIEYVKGAVFANLWMQNRIAKIDPETGKVLAYLDLSEIAKQEPEYDQNRDGQEMEKVLNGIAYIPEKDHLLVTGKRWSTIYEIKITEE